MKTLKIILPKVEDVRNFVNTVSRFDVDMDLRSGRYVVDAKSLLAIFSLDLMSPIEVVVYTDGEEADKVIDEIKKYMIE